MTNLKNELHHAIAAPVDAIVRRALSHLVSSILKRDDAPMSSETHMAQALTDLSELVSDWREFPSDMADVIDDAREYMALMGYPNR